MGRLNNWTYLYRERSLTQTRALFYCDGNYGKMGHRFKNAECGWSSCCHTSLFSGGVIWCRAGPIRRCDCLKILTGTNDDTWYFNTNCCHLSRDRFKSILSFQLVGVGEIVMRKYGYRLIMCHLGAFHVFGSRHFNVVRCNFSRLWSR